MDFPRIDHALRVCRRHLSEPDDLREAMEIERPDDKPVAGSARPLEDRPDSPEIESLLVSSVVLLIVSHYESHIAERFAERAARSGDPEIASFVKQQIARRFRSPDIGKINAALKDFGADCHRRFSDRLTDQAQASWDNILRARHVIVHGNTSVNMTLDELETAYHDSHEVLAALAASLGLPEVSTR